MAIVEEQGHLGAPDGGIVGIECRRRGKGGASGIRIAPAIEQVAAVQVILGIVRGDPQGSIDRLDCRVQPIEEHFDRRQDTQQAVVTWVPGGGPAHEPGGGLDIAAAQQQFRRVDRRAAVIGRQLQGADGVGGCAS